MISCDMDFSNKSPHTTTADVLLFFSSALSLSLYKEMFEDRFNQKFLPVNKLVKISTKCFHEIINSKNGHDVYYVALVLHPGRILPLWLDIKLICLVLVLL